MSEVTLERAIEQQINLGHKDPHEFYDLLVKQLGDELAEIARPYLADFISEMARQRINQQRRASVAKISASSLADSEVLLKSLWVPSPDGITYKAIGHMTAADFTARAEYLDRMVHGIARHAQWCRDCAAAIKRSRVKTASELKALPALEDE